MLLLHVIGYTQTLDVNFLGMIHAESETMFAKENNNTYPSENNHFISLYTKLALTYDISDNIFVAAAAKANGVILEGTYETPHYLRSKLTSDDISRAIISEASINYDDNFFALNIGRNSINYDWLRGSMDGIIGMVGNEEIYALRLFWMNNFTQLHYNYYAEFPDINENKGMYGAIATAKAGNLEITLYDYYMQELRNILGMHINYIDNYRAFNIGHTETKALSHALYDSDESFLNFSIEILRNNHFVEFGGSFTGENGLLAMVQMGSFMFGQFYLSNQVDREYATNGFIRYIYANKQWRFELLGGITSYDNTMGSIQSNLLSQEIDIYVSYKFNKNLSIDFGMMGMNVQERDPVEVDQALIMTNAVYTYENF